MISLILLTINGSIVSGIVIIANRIFRYSMTARIRRIWWLLAALAFLVRLPLPLLPVGHHPGLEVASPIYPYTDSGSTGVMNGAINNVLTTTNQSWWWIVIAVWLMGAIGYASLIIIRTIQTHQFWSHQRLSTDSKLLQILEDAKSELGVITPFGLVVTDDVTSPAILGWVRPRILLPTRLCAILQSAELRLVLKHELAHFRAGDLIWNSLFFITTALHWFNPMAHLAQAQWRDFIEESADETTLSLLNGPDSLVYGEVLLKAVRHVNGLAPCGALAIGETLQQLKTRILMINNYSAKRNRPLVAAAVLVPMLCLMLPLTHAEDSTTDSDAKKEATAAITPWLTEIDAGDYKKSWTDASGFFRKALSQDSWTNALTSVRTPLGKCLGRELVSELHQTNVPSPSGTIKGDFVIAQYKSRFENLAFAIETITFQKDDGLWKASGYYIKPN